MPRGVTLQTSASPSACSRRIMPCRSRARRAAAPGFSLPLEPGRHVFGSEPGGADLTVGPAGVEVPASDGPRLDVWSLATE